MKKFIILFCLVLISSALWAKSVSREDEQKIAVSFYRLNNTVGVQNPQIRSSWVKSWQNIPVFYEFRFSSGGFVLVAADDASIPILAYSFENDITEVIENPATKEWLDNYSREISYIINNHLDNRETLMEWNSIQNGEPLAPALDVLPLLTTTWQQGCYYNEMCPADASGLCGHVMTGCVATAMAQIMKYHNFPPQGVGQHSYDDPPYGWQSVDFGNTTYDWSSMPNSVTSSNTAVATINYHAGVSVNMQYGASASGAFIIDVPGALMNYFNYHPDIDIKYKDNYFNVEDFKALLRADLDKSLPIFYSGFGSSGHAFVCDGYRMSDGKFHFNWGFGNNGVFNGYYAIGYLNPGVFNFNFNNSVVVHIKPYNPNLIVRITHPLDKAVIGAGYSVDIKAKTVRGTPTTMKIFIDSIEKFSVNADSIEYTWYTSTADLGNHIVKAFAYNVTDTVYYKIFVNVAEWLPQASGFTASRIITYLSAVDSNIVWGTATDPNNMFGACSDFTRTTNGGTTWIPGVITNTAGLGSGMIFALDSLKAYVAMYKVSGNKPMGIYVTTDGGVTWTRQATASFSNSASFPDVVHFFNFNDGVAIGDPINGKFEIYTTTNGGNNWTLIPDLGNPAPEPGEWCIVGFYSAVHDTIWFGTTQGRVYKSANKGLNWSVSTAVLISGQCARPMFRNGLHGLLLDQSSNTGNLWETSNGGTSWTPVNFTGSTYSWDIAYVPGTPNTYVRSDFYNGYNGCAYSFDGGHTWSDFIGTTGAPFYNMDWVNKHCGWAGGISTDSVENGVYRYIGVLMPALPTPVNLLPQVTNHNVHLTWNPPVYDSTLMTLLGYNMYRNGLKLNVNTITSLVYDDLNVPTGEYTYCVNALYNLGESAGDCEIADIAVMVPGTNSKSSLLIYPNPASNIVHITFNNYSKENKVLSIRNILGEELLSNQIQSVETVIDVSNLPNGLYFVGVNTGNKPMVSTKLIILK